MSFFHKKPEIVAALCVYNEEKNIDGCLTHLENFVDRIVVFDDGSTDDTIKIAKNHKKVKIIITNSKKSSWQERNNRKKILETIYKTSKNKKNVWALCIDADERFEEAFLNNIKLLVEKPEYQGLVIALHFRELWDDPAHYRVDGIWGEKRKAILFKLRPKMTFNYQQEHHIPWYFQELAGQEILLDYNLYHLKMIKPSDRQARVDLYNKLDPEKKMQPIGYDYLTDTKNIKLKRIEKNHSYNITTIPKYYI